MRKELRINRTEHIEKEQDNTRDNITKQNKTKQSITGHNQKVQETNEKD